MNRWKKVAMSAAAIALSATMVFGLAACSGESSSSTMGTITIDENNLEAYEAQSSKIYDDQLGEFYEAYMAAKAITGSDAESVSQRYALMAIAEAKLMESAVMLPSTTNGGNYAVSSAVPHTHSYVLWGNDSYRYHQMLVATQLLTTDDRDEVTSIYSEMLSSGEEFDGWASSDAYVAEVREYLEGQGYIIKDSYSMSYSGTPTTFDVLATSQAVDSEVLVNTYDGLVEYDELGYLQYALADDHVVSDDGLHYYFHIRDGANWYTSGGTSAYAAVTADDFVAGFQHMMDAQGGLEYLVEGVIEGATEYIYGQTTDFDDVGVKAGTYDEATGTFTADEDGEWVEYTLVDECSYFMTMLGYGVFAPMNREYFLSQGGAFGITAFAAAEANTNYAYGLSEDNILYCGPYKCTQVGNNFTFEAYEGYWNYDHINLKTITWYYYDGSDPSATYNDMRAGTLDGAGLNTTSLQLARTDTTTDLHGNSGTYYDLFGYVSETDATSFMAFYNLNRKAFANYNDGTTAASSKTELDAYRTKSAMQNVHFRRAISFAFDRATFNAASVGDDLAYNSLRNSFTPGTFVQISSATTIEINGNSVTYPVGTYYGEIMQDQIDADGVAIKVWDDELMSSDGFDGWYNTEAALEELEIAINELSIDGINISADNPIQIDYVYVESNSVYYNRAQVYKQSLEEALDGCVQVNLIGVSSAADWYYSGYYPSNGYDMNYDMNDVSGWGPDYGDPSTYLDTMLPDGYGYMLKAIGLW